MSGVIREAAAGLAVLLALSACTTSSAPPSKSAASTASATRAPTPPVPTSPVPISLAPHRTVATHPPAPAKAPRAAPIRSATSHRADPPKPATSALPLDYSTGNARQLITVTASSGSSTVATLQAWTKGTGGWRRYDGPVTAHLGADGVGQASESTSRTPAGSFTLTQAFGHDSDPGTALPYTHTNPSYWWISQAGSLYNTMQSCSAGCGFTQGDPNEHLYYETPYYNYAVVIDYNTRNAPGGVRAGAGSAFFLHVTDGRPTAGCVSIPQANLVALMRWLQPGEHPRILIGVR